MQITAKLDRAKIDTDSDYTGHLMVSLKAPEAMPGQKRMPVSIALCLDVSGSMANATDSGQTKIEAVKDVAAKVIRNLTAEDELTLITFTGNVETLILREKVINKDAMVAKVSCLRAHTSTNLSGGMIEGLASLVESGIKGVRRVLLLTDGLPSGGGSKEDILAYLTKAAAQKRDNPVTLSTFGFGLDADQELLASMAQLGGGNYTYVKGGSDIGNLFARELGGIMSCVAQNIRVSVKPGKGNEVLEVLNDMKVREYTDNDMACAEVDAEDIYAGETKHVLIKFKVAKPETKPKDRAFSVCHVNVTCSDLKTAKIESVSHNVKVEFVKADEADKDAALDVAEQVALVEAAHKQIEAVKLANAGDYLGAQGLLRSMGGQLKGLADRGSSQAEELTASMGQVCNKFNAVDYSSELGAAVSGTARSATRYRGGAGGQCVGALNVSMENKAMKKMAEAFDDQPKPAGIDLLKEQQAAAAAALPARKSLAKEKRQTR